MITVTGPDDVRLYRFLEWAIMRERPVTITYLKQSKDQRGKFLWRWVDGAQVPVLEPTIRTIEPWTIEHGRTGDAFVRGMDRDSNEPRSWRLDRIQKITYHKRGKQIIPAWVNMSVTKRA
jgi:hypothetical protein